MMIRIVRCLLVLLTVTLIVVGLDVAPVAATGAGIARSRPESPATRAAGIGYRGICTALLLNLRPGMRLTNGRLDRSSPVPRNMPTYVIPVELPLYPGSKVSRRPAPSWMEIASLGTDYVKSAVATYVAAAPMRLVISWYQRALSACGLVSNGGGSASGPGYFAKSITFGARAAPDLDEGASGISFSRGAHGRTMVLYWLIATSYPNRPEWTYVPERSKKMWLSFTPACGPFHPSPCPHTSSGTITDPHTITAIADAFNQEDTVDESGVHGCLMSGASGTLVVTKADGRRMWASVDGACGSYSISARVRGVRRTVGFAGTESVVDVLGLVARLQQGG
jgi:hypothetical protein